MAATTPHANAAAEFPVAAAANRSVFFNQQGGPRGAGEVYSLLAARLEAARLAMHAPAAAAPVRAAVPAATPDPADSFDAMTTMTGVPVAQGESSAAPFHSLFQTGGRRQAISPVVAALWGGQGQAVSAPVATSANIATPSVPPPTVQRAAPAQPPDLRGLYQNDAPNLRGLFDGTS
jgi:hypothetical protein